MPTTANPPAETRPPGFDADESEADGPVSSFQSYAAEGDILAKQGEFRKAIEAYSKALTLRPTEKNCLVARSKCHLQLGDSGQALQDAEAALKEDTEFFKGMYQKAEALYAKGDFEMALVYYHRGNKLRPELDEFRLGIQKAREAIDNSIGNPRDYKFKPPTDFSLNGNKPSNPAIIGRGTSLKKSGKVAKSTVTVNTINNTRKIIPRGESAASSTTPERDVKQLLGELYVDMEYLQQLLHDKDFINNPNDRIFELVCDGLKYLETRTEFWRQQKPIYARRKEAAAIKTKMASARTRQLEREHTKEESKEREAQEEAAARKAEKQQHKQQQQQRQAAVAARKAAGGQPSPTGIDKVEGGRSTGTSPERPKLPKDGGRSAGGSPERPKLPTKPRKPEDLLEAINAASQANDHAQVLALGQDFLDFKEDPGSDVERSKVMVHSVMGTALMEKGHFSQAEEQYLDALAVPTITTEQKSTVLGHVGRACAKQKNFANATEHWEAQLALDCNLSLVEKAWLHHDIARCCVELGQDAKAREMADKACEYAIEANEPRWILNTNVLGGQVFSTENPEKARGYYTTALETARNLNEENAVAVISKGLDALPAAQA